MSQKDDERFSKSGQKRLLRETKSWKLHESITNSKVKKGFSSDISVYSNLIKNPTFKKLLKAGASELKININNLKKIETNFENLKWEDHVQLNKVISLVIWYDLFINKRFINE